VSAKTIVCRCEDVTLDDVTHTLSIGYHTVEEVKRYTGLGTGPCQGKECMVHAATLCAARSTLLPEPFTARPPVAPAPLGIFAGLGPDEPEKAP
jgi:bacterioferritin-associated ferredoxin